ncbi:MAG: GNAT family N-acetyltransferase, partial [Bacteroidales bacterium]|nr:GNAT family N-acetyltransferase [Bacteroidales bacterium]
MEKIHFTTLTAESLKEIAHYASLCDNRVSDYSLANLYGWQPRFNTQYAIVDHHLVVRYLSENGTWYMRPLPPRKGDCSQTPSVIERLREDAFLSGHDFCLYGLKQEEAETMKTKHGDRMTIEPRRESAGYLYLREKLSTLSGRKLQAKRNHVNKFHSLYADYEYKPIDSNLTDECIAFAQQWAERHVALFPEQADSAEAELTAIRRCLTHWDAMPLMGGTLWVAGQLVAFTYGCPVSDDTVDVCVEKADTSYEGAYTVINQLFAQHVPEQYLYLNREEDMGVEGLRKAKLSYHPEEILERYACVEPLPRPADEREQAKALWQQTFGDSQAFADLYFDRVYSKECTVACIEGEQLIASLQLLPYGMKWHEDTTEAAYVSGVMTREEWRGKGIGRELMRQAHIKAYGEGKVFVMLMAASERAARWYELMGYAKGGFCSAAPEGASTMNHTELARWENTHDTVLLHSEENLAIVQQNMQQEGLSAD